MFITITYFNNTFKETEFNNVYEAITYIYNQINNKLAINGDISYNNELVAIILPHINYLLIKVYNSKLVTNNLKLNLPITVKFEVVPNKNNKSNQSVFNNVTVGGSISLGELK